jgi:hypothetical protein
MLARQLLTARGRAGRDAVVPAVISRLATVTDP